LGHDDVLIICSGTNDPAVNKSTYTFQNISNFVTRNNTLMSCWFTRNNHTNVILVNVPYRYDTGNSSIINEAIERLNKKLNKLVTVSPHASFLKIDQNRNLFMNHGLHHNRFGNQIFFHQIAIMVYSLFEQRNTCPIHLGWHNDDKSMTLKNSKPNASKYHEHQSTLHNNNQDNSINRITTRNRRLPVRRSADFLW
jgi:hypothetical protein